MTETLKNERRLIGNIQVVQSLKRKQLIAESVSDFIRLPKDPDKRIILVHVDPRFLLDSERRKYFSLNSKEVRMN